MFRLLRISVTQTLPLSSPSFPVRLMSAMLSAFSLVPLVPLLAWCSCGGARGRLSACLWLPSSVASSACNFFRRGRGDYPLSLIFFKGVIFSRLMLLLSWWLTVTGTQFPLL